MTAPHLKSHFSGAAKNGPDQTTKPDKPSTLTIRLRPHERERLERLAGKLSLSAYARRKLFGEAARETAVQPKADHVVLAQLLAKLGQSSLSHSLAVLALASKNGALPVLEETEDALQQSCRDIAQMKSLLMDGLGIQET